MDAQDIRVWCMQHPRPQVIRCTNADGMAQEVIVSGAWTKLADTIHALQPELLEALTAEKQLIRALRPNDLTEEWDGDSADQQQPQPRARRGVAPSFANIPITAADPETQRFALVASLLADAYRHANEAHDTAFQHLVELVNSNTRRSESVERARDQLHRAEIARLRQQITELGQEPTGDGPLNLQDLLGAVLTGAAQSGGTPTSNGKGQA